MAKFTRRDFLRHSSFAIAAAGTSGWLSGCSDDNGDFTFVKTPLPQDENGRWWLSNNFAPVAGESEALNLNVIGELPRALNGLYARNGSNLDDTDHWFLGHGMFHGIRLEDGRALWYRNRYIHTALRVAGTDDLSPSDPISSYSNVSTVYHANKLLTLGEIGLPYQVSPADLSTVGVYDFAGRLNGSMTAHPKIDAATGQMLFFGYDFAPPYLTYYEVDASGELSRSVDITLPASVMMHDFAITQNYVIFYDLPVVFDIEKALAGEGFPFKWSFEHVPRMGVMPRKGGDADIQWFEIESCFIFHTMNAYENPENPQELVLDVSRIDAPFWAESNADLSKPSYLSRYRFDLENTSVSLTRLADTPMDFGQLNRRLTGQYYRYGYGLDFSETSASAYEIATARSIVRQDHQTGQTEHHDPGPGIVLSEALFVPDPNGTGEQDGWIMCYAFNEARCQTDLLVVDARDFSGAAVARIELPFRVPYGFHGVWVPDAL